MSDEMRRLLNLVESAPDPDQIVSREHDGIQFHFCFRTSKEALNKSNHDGLSLQDGIEPFFSPLSKFEIIFENGEERKKLIGPGANGQLLVVILQEIEEDAQERFDTAAWIRLISVYKPGPAEILRYKGPVMEDSGIVKGAFEQEQEPMQPALPYFMRRARERKARVEARAAEWRERYGAQSDPGVCGANHPGPSSKPARNPAEQPQ